MNGMTWRRCGIGNLFEAQQGAEADVAFSKEVRRMLSSLICFV
jgi:hypothetical protein